MYSNVVEGFCMPECGSNVAQLASVLQTLGVYVRHADFFPLNAANCGHADKQGVAI